MKQSIVKNNHLPWLDALRFCAAFMVLLSHSRNDFFVAYDAVPQELKAGGANFVLYTLCRLGHEAVMIFFVISGFLVCGRGLERIHNNDFRLKNYAVDRIVRIGLPLLGAIILFYFVCQVTHTEFSWITAVGNLFSLQGILVDDLVPPFWSLSYEVWFYVLLATVGMVYQKKKGGFLLFFVVCLVFCKLDPIYLLMWIMGGMAYIFRPSKGNGFLLVSYLVLMIASMASLQLTTASHAMEGLVFSFNRSILEVIYAFFCALFIQQIILFTPKHKIAIKIDRFMSRCADFSYTLYLSHRIIFLVLFAFLYEKGAYLPNLQGWLTYLSFLAIVLVSCYCVYLLSEKHTARVKKFVKSKLSIV